MTDPTGAASFVPTPRLLELTEELKDLRPCKRGPNGFEVPTWVLPISPVEATMILNELIARRRREES